MLRRRVIVIVILLIVAGSVAGLWFSRESEPICRASFDRIHEGMTQKMVEEILGGPAGDFRKHHRGFLHIEFIGQEGQQQAWHGDLGSVFVWFDEPGRVIGKEYIDNLENETFSDWLRRILRIR